jgi:uncharacterized repeat protein (TIGR01451 family)
MIDGRSSAVADLRPLGITLFLVCLAVDAYGGAASASAIGTSVPEPQAASQGRELLADGGFERSPTRETTWIQTSVQYGTPITPAACGTGGGPGPHGGSSMVWFAGSAMTVESGAVERRDLVIPPGAGPLTFWYAAPRCVVNGAGDYLRLEVDGVNAFEVRCTTPIETWQQASIDLAPWADGAQHDLRFIGYASSSGYLNFSDFLLDDVSLRVSTVVARDVPRAEGDAGTTLVNIPVELHPASQHEVLVDWATADGTADASDYVGASGTVHFAAGQTVTFATVAIIGETVAEQNETFQLRLSNPRMALIDRDQALVTIVDDDTGLTDLSINMPASVSGDANTTITIPITIHNGGPKAAAGVEVVTEVPEGMRFLSATPTSGSCTGSSTITCIIGALDNGSSASVQLTLTGSQAGTFTSSATVTSATADPTTPNTASTSVQVTHAVADLSVSVPASITSLRDETFTLRVSVHNNGPDVASNPVLTDVLPTGLTLVSAVPSQGSCSGSTTLTCSLGAMESGASATVHLHLKGTAAGNFTHTVDGTASPDLDPTLPDRASTSVQITTIARIDLNAPPSVNNGRAFVFSASIIDSLGHVVHGHAGRVQFSSSDPGARLPDPQLLEDGVTFSAMFLSEGRQTLTAADGAVSGSARIDVVRVTRVEGPAATGTGTVVASFTGGGPYCHFEHARLLTIAELPAALNGVMFPHGLFDFTLTHCTPGSTIVMTMSYPLTLRDDSKYWKYGPRPGPLAAAWYELTTAQRSGNTFTFTITDGALGDDDLVANGTIIDQGGPAAPTEAIPVGSMPGWVGLIFLCALAGVFALRH